MSKEKRSVVIVDDHPLVRAGLRSLIGELDVYEVVAEAEDAMGAIEVADRFKPGVMVLDVHMPGMSGLEVLPTVKSISPDTGILVVSVDASHHLVMEALRRGADGYLLKDFAAIELQLALDSVMSGRRFLSPTVSGAVVSHALSCEAGAGEASEPSASLTPRQLEILRLIAKGCSTRDMASELDLSIKTVETHRSQIMKRLDIHDVPRLVLYAVRHGIVSATDELH